MCPACHASTHRSRSRSWVERVRRLVTGRAPFRCSACGWRGWRVDEQVELVDGPREVHRPLTEAELERLEPDQPEGDDT
jgi:hypothetical protein